LTDDQIAPSTNGRINKGWQWIIGSSKSEKKRLASSGHFAESCPFAILACTRSIVYMVNTELTQLESTFLKNLFYSSLSLLG